MKPLIGIKGIILISLVFVLIACRPGVSAESALIPVTVQLSFYHQAEFAGFYAADQLGYYAEEGIDVSFLEGGPDVDFIPPVVEGAAQFGVAQPADLILARAAGKPVRSIAAIYRHNPIVFIALAESGISRPHDFIGKKIRSTTTADQTLWAMMSKVGIPRDLYETVYLPSEVEQFATGDVPVWVGFINVFVLELQRAGYDLNIIYPDDYGIHFYGDVLITTDDLIEQNPELVQRFLQATLRGWMYAIENPDEIGVFVQVYEPDADAGLEADRMTASIPLVNTGEDFIGWMKAETWEGMEKTLREQGALTLPLEISDVYTLQFIEEMYRK